MKRASADMWWIIIGAVIALVVMIILMVLFTGKTTKVEGGLLSCEGKGGDCRNFDECQKEGGTVSSAFECGRGDLQCCFSPKALKKNNGESCTSDAQCKSNRCNRNGQEPGECFS